MVRPNFELLDTSQNTLALAIIKAHGLKQSLFCSPCYTSIYGSWTIFSKLRLANAAENLVK